MTTQPTIGQTIEQVRTALRDYIEATYHISHPQIVGQRRELLDRPGVIAQTPYLESTPRYIAGDRFESLDLPPAALELFDLMARPTADGGLGLLHNPPYAHQARALTEAVRNERSLVVTTGTGSGKTESFLLPIVAKLAVEARERPAAFAAPAVRALVLYPMNALVNDQLGRLRLLLGNDGVAGQFTTWANRPARFARYTGRTLYPGVRTRKKDSTRLRPIDKFYVDLLDRADGNDAAAERARDLVQNLKARGKWPAKADLRAWYGQSGSHWQRGGEFVRAITQPGDAELFTRHEALAAPPDVLVTNYSMLEYMLMRPLERPIFDATRQWLNQNPDERLLLVIDEAHLYRGAAGAEVALLIRRLQARLGLSHERLQVICTSASFSDSDAACDFAAALAGKTRDTFVPIGGQLDLRPASGPGEDDERALLADIDLNELYANEERRRNAVAPFLHQRDVDPSSEDIDAALYSALETYPPMGTLVNLTMSEARPPHELAIECLGQAGDEADRALAALVALGSMARLRPGEPGLLPCRIHSFFRGLPGLWACTDPDCSGVDGGGPIGKLYDQPRDACDHCGARVFEFFTCRHCGSAYGRAYTDKISDPEFLWSEPGARFEAVSGYVVELEALDICLEDPLAEGVEPAELDLVTGRLNPMELGERSRQVFIPRDRMPTESSGDDDEGGTSVRRPGEFRPCGVCGKQAGYGRSSVQDHQTKGDQPFQAIVTRQLEVQPPGPQPATEFAPLRGRKVLAFSDSRQVAARLAPNLQTYAMRDVLRPLLLLGFRQLREHSSVSRKVGLDDAHLAVLLAARISEIRLRPELKSGESLQLQHDLDRISLSDLSDPEVLDELLADARAATPPASLLRGLVSTIADRWTGLQSLALGSLAERERDTTKLLEDLPALPGFSSDEERQALVRLWINQWTEPGLWFTTMPSAWWNTEVRGHKGKFKSFTSWFEDKEPRLAFEKTWLPVLLAHFCEVQGDTYRMRASRLTLDTSAGWAWCGTCRTTQRPIPNSTRCVACRRKDVRPVDPDSDAVFRARKGYYRQSTLRALADPPVPPTVIVAAEHTAQLGEAQGDAVFSKAEEHELLFQDVDLGGATGNSRQSAIDVLSCTTTMEVGIDIGSLSGVALRNMPPSRASYQQRAGRAGRRGNALATVTAFGSADSHDEHYFREPDAMIRGRVDDPLLSLDNADITRRHVTAFLLQRYHSVRLPSIDPEQQPQLFEVLGKVDDFMRADSILSRDDFAGWLAENEDDLRTEIAGWLPNELEQAANDEILDTFVAYTMGRIDYALDWSDADEQAIPASSAQLDDDDDEAAADDEIEVQAETGEEKAHPESARENLLDRLLYKGVLPRYAFPTDVVSFHVFDTEQSTRYRAVFRYAPSQGLPVALTQYAPGKEVWIDGKLWTSGALYSPMPSDRFNAWSRGRLYFECEVCRYARTVSREDAERGERGDCPACGAEGKFGGARNWIRPPGFAHPYTIEEGTSPDDQPARSYATRAKLMASSEAAHWTPVTDRVRSYYNRDFLLVTNTGPNREGYTYCLRCGVIEPTAMPTGRVSGAHPKPYPDRKEPDCPGGMSTRGLVLGTDFVSDVLLIALRVDEPLTLRPALLATDVALRTVADAITIASATHLEIEHGELQAEYRPALTELGKDGLEAEIYLYDTLAGGAGFAREVGVHIDGILRSALALLENCPGDCDRSCYRCLRSFRNRFEHHQLDRFVGASLLRYLLDGEEPVLEPGRLKRSADRLFEDLERQGLDGVSFERDKLVDVPGVGQVAAPICATAGDRTFIVGVHAPLTPDYPADPLLREAKEFGASVPIELIDDIVISQHLPAATRQVIQRVVGR